MDETNVQLMCPISRKAFETPRNKGVPYVTVSSGTDKMIKPHTIFFSPYSQVGIAYPPLSEQQLHAIYERGEYWNSSKEEIFTPKTSPGLYAMAESRWWTVAPLLKGRGNLSILDIGGGHGFFGMVAAESKKNAVKKYAIAEMDELFRRSLKKTWDRRFPQVEFRVEDQVPKFQGQYDLIVLSHILEHLNDPRAMLFQAIERMDPEGLLFVDVPHEDFRFKKDVFPHILFYNPLSLRLLVESVGLKVMHVGCYGKDMKRSPMNYLNDNNFPTFISAILNKSKWFWPTGILKAFYANYFGAREENANGTWVRLVAKQ